MSNKMLNKKSHKVSDETFSETSEDSIETSVDSIVYQTLQQAIIYGLIFVVIISLMFHAAAPSKTRGTPAPTVQHRITSYEILGVDPHDDYPVIVSAWRQRSEDTHPDKIGHEHFEEYLSIQQAYYDISNDPLRCSYDQNRGIKGLWTDRYEECNEILLPYILALSQRDKEREAKMLKERLRKEKTREERARKEDKTFRDSTSRNGTSRDAPSGTLNIDKDIVRYWAPGHHTVEEDTPEEVKNAEKEQGAGRDNDLRPQNQGSVPTPPKVKRVLTSQDFGVGFIVGRLAYWFVQRVAV